MSMPRLGLVSVLAAISLGAGCRDHSLPPGFPARGEPDAETEGPSPPGSPSWPREAGHSPGEAKGGDWREDTPPAECEFEREWPETIRIGVTPYVGSAVVEAEFSGVVEYLAHELRRPVRFVPSVGYSDLVEKLERNEVDVVSLAPLSYVRAKDRSPCMALLLTQVSRGSTHYSSYIMVRASSDISTINDLVGRSFAFAPADSASGYLFPRAFLSRQGIDPDSAFSRVEHGTEHLSTLRLLAEGKVDAAATFDRAVQLGRRAGIDTGRLRVLAVTGHIPFDAVCARPGLNRDLAVRVQDALIRLNSTTEEGRDILVHEMELNGWVRTSDSLYDPVREIAGIPVRGGGNSVGGRTP